jgi:hypothetical protein
VIAARRIKMRRLTLAIVAALLLGSGACDLSQHCDPGQVYVDRTCVNVPDAGAGASDGGDDSSALGVDDGGGSCSPYQGFGGTCTATSQCSCGLDSCNTFMNANYCTHTHCLADPSICPPGWTCLDVSAFDPATGSACLRP